MGISRELEDATSSCVAISFRSVKLYTPPIRCPNAEAIKSASRASGHGLLRICVDATTGTLLAMGASWHCASV